MGRPMKLSRTTTFTNDSIGWNLVFPKYSNIAFLFFFFLNGFTPCKAEQPLRGMKLQEKEPQKDCNILEICLERTQS